MNTRFSKRIRWGNALKLGFVLSTAMAPLLMQPASAAMPTVGVACTPPTTGASPNPVYILDTREGYIQLPDSNTMYMWGYSEGGDTFQHPGPVLCVNQGDTVTVTLRNNLAENTSIIFPGFEGVLANGVPAQPQFDGTGNLTSLTNVAAPGGSVTYSFVAPEPGSYLYESGTSPAKQVPMGLFGALIVRPTMGADYAYNRADSHFTATEEFMVLLSAIDPNQHQAAENGDAFNLNNYAPRYWLINGRGFPDSIVDNFSPFLPDQPYGALAQIKPYDIAAHPLPGRIHYINVGNEAYPFHPHGNNGLVIGRDGRPVAGAAGEDLSFEKFAINIGPGQTWDVIFKWYDAENYSAANPVPVNIPQVNNVEFGMFYSGSPYLGTTGPLPPGMQTLNECGSYYIISHNHALYQITSWGVNMSGPITYVRIDHPTLCP